MKDLFTQDPDRFKFPDKYRPTPKKKKQSPANSLTDAVISLIKLLGGTAYRISSQGTYMAKIDLMVASTQKKGLPDVVAILKGQFIGIEVKIGKDRMSEHQLKRKEEIEKAGGRFIVARDIEQVKAELQ
jgi:hypothetical protein